MRTFDQIRKHLNEEQYNQDVGAYGKRPSFDVKYRKMEVSKKGFLAAVRRVGWDSTAGSSHRYSIFHVPTRTDLTITFRDLGEAEKFMHDAEEQWDWDFDKMGGDKSKQIDQDGLYRLAGKHNAIDFLGNQILSNAHRE